MDRRHALIIPVICPITEHITTPVSIDDHITYGELKHETRYRLAGDIFNLYEKKRRLRMGSFAQLDDSFEGYDVVFLHPFEVVRALQARIIVSDNGHIASMGNIGTGKELEEHLAELWYRGNVVIASNYIAEAIVDNLTLTVQRYRMPPRMYTYCYGRIRRIVRKLDVKKVLEDSKPIAVPPPHLEDKERVKMVYDFLVYTPTRWPWATWGLIVDRTRNWIVVLNPDTMGFIKAGDIEELRELRYRGRPIPVIIVKKLTLARRLGEELFAEHPSRLDTLLSYTILGFKLQTRLLMGDGREV